VFGRFLTPAADAQRTLPTGENTVMYINRLMLLFVGVALIFFPAVESWMINSETAWYRPYQLWLLVVVATYWNQRTRYPDEL
jgi:hypothetical protein